MIYASLTCETEADGDQFKSIIIEVGNHLDVKGKELFNPIRITLYGKPKGPDIPLIFSILGRNETLNRIYQVIK